VEPIVFVGIEMERACGNSEFRILNSEFEFAGSAKLLRMNDRSFSQETTEGGKP
jgi:hypothetical protein